jgi:hypothetical protein
VLVTPVRRRGNCRTFGTLAVTLLFLAGCAGDTEEDARRCSPELSASSATGDGDEANGDLSPGGLLTVRGAGFATTCDDGEPTGQPLQSIRLFISQGDQRYAVAKTNADESFGFEAIVGIPADFQAGNVTVTAHESTEDDSPVLASTTLELAGS